MSLRCIVGSRVSVVKGPQKVSQLAQIETGARWVAEHQGEVVATFEDMGVSASVPPDQRPDLGPWITKPEMIEQYDALVFSKMDRAFRSIRHCVETARWAEDHQKLLVFAEDGLQLDYRAGRDKGVDSMLSELFVYIGAFFAELELNRFKTRAQDSHRMIRPTTRWASGAPPYGYQIVDHPSGKGKGLAPDPEQQAHIRSMADRLLAGESFTSIAHDIPRWNTTNVIECLTSPRTQGWKTTNRGKTIVTDELGEPIRMAEPTFDPETWEQIQRVAQERKIDRKRTHSANPMLGVGFCQQCGAGLAQQFSTYKRVDGSEHTSRYYRCSRVPRNCKQTMVNADMLDSLLEEHFLEAYGDQPVTTRRWQQGSDGAAELADVESQIRRLRSEQDMGLIVTDEDHEYYLQRMTVLVDRRKALSASEPVLSGWVYEETGETFQAVWERSSPEERRSMLTDRGVRLELTKNKPLEWRLVVPDVSDPERKAG